MRCRLLRSYLLVGALLLLVGALLSSFQGATPSAPPAGLVRVARQLKLNPEDSGRIGLLTFSTGSYNVFVPQFVASIREHLCPGSQITKHIILFTDDLEMQTVLAEYESELLEITVVQVKPEPWPQSSMLRVHKMLEHADVFKRDDIVVNIDSDLLFRSDVCSEFLTGSFGTLVPWFEGGPRETWSFETNPKSAAFVDFNKAQYYYTGALFGGERMWFLDTISMMKRLTDKDLGQRPPFIPIWHDESILNRVLLDSPPDTVLSGFYLFPEPPSHLWLVSQRPEVWLTPDRRSLRSDIKIVHIFKSKDAIRQLGERVRLQDAHAMSLAASAVVRDVTVVILHYNRRACLERLLISLSIEYAGVAVIVVDSSEVATDQHFLKSNEFLQVIRTEPDIGISAMRMIGANATKTPYLLFLDDDIQITSETRLDHMLDILQTHDQPGAGGVDLVGVQLSEFPVASESPLAKRLETSLSGWRLRRDGLSLIQESHIDMHATTGPMAPAAYRLSTEYPTCYRADFVENMYMTRTELFKTGRLKYDRRLKLGEHEDFFVHAQEQHVRSVFCNGLSFMVVNDHGKGCNEGEQTAEQFRLYLEKRRRQFEWWVIMFQKHHIEELVTPAASYRLSCGSLSASYRTPNCIVKAVNQEYVWWEEEMMPEAAPAAPAAKTFLPERHSGFYEASKGCTDRVLTSPLFDGTAVHFAAVGSPARLPLTEFTLDVWVKTGSVRYEGTILSTVSQPNGRGLVLRFVFGQLMVEIHGGPHLKTIHVLSGRVSTYEWHHILVTSKPEDKLILFVDGEKRAVTESPDAAFDALPAAAEDADHHHPEHLFIGCLSDWSGHGFFRFRGRIATARLWKTGGADAARAVNLSRQPVGDLGSPDELLWSYDLGFIDRGVVLPSGGLGAVPLRHEGPLDVRTDTTSHCTEDR
eukprot:m.309252 g.309252  ORF g.309252 m.309252 type:complete len:923 (+) comp22777_c0_seq1:87-2855(+)